jgi:uncharacterized phage protein (TIGR01671 family)
MKREIKFRGKSVFKNEWWTGFYIYSDYEKKHFIVQNAVDNKAPNGSISFAHFAEIEVKTLGEITGFKDKNGVDIYEGDIIEKHFEKFEIIWNEGAWQLTKINDWYKQQFYIAHLFDYEKAVVVGNIYEN